VTQDIPGFSWITGAPHPLDAGSFLPDRIRRVVPPKKEEGALPGAAASAQKVAGGAAAQRKKEEKPSSPKSSASVEVEAIKGKSKSGGGGVAGGGGQQQQPPTLREVATALGNAIDFAGGKLSLAEAGTIVPSVLSNFSLLNTKLKPLVVSKKLQGISFLFAPGVVGGFFVRSPAAPPPAAASSASSSSSAHPTAAAASNKTQGEKGGGGGGEEGGAEAARRAIEATLGAAVDKAPNKHLDPANWGVVSRKLSPSVKAWFDSFDLPLKLFIQQGQLKGLQWVDGEDPATGKKRTWVERVGVNNNNNKQKTTPPQASQPFAAAAGAGAAASSPMSSDGGGGGDGGPKPNKSSPSPSPSSRGAVLAEAARVLCKLIDEKPDKRLATAQAGAAAFKVKGYQALGEKMMTLVNSGSLPGLVWVLDDKTQYVARAPSPVAGGGAKTNNNNGDGGAAAVATENNNTSSSNTSGKVGGGKGGGKAPGEKNKKLQAPASGAKHPAKPRPPPQKQARVNAAALTAAMDQPPPVDRGAFFLGGL
jgi:hypothetical protein